MLFPSTFGFPGQHCFDDDDDDDNAGWMDWRGSDWLWWRWPWHRDNRGRQPARERDLSTPKKTNKLETDSRSMEGEESSNLSPQSLTASDISDFARCLRVR